MKLPPINPNKKYFKNQREIQERYGITRHKVQEYKKDRPELQDENGTGRYNVDAWDTFMTEEVAQNSEDQEAINLDKNELICLELQEKHRKLKIENDQKEGVLVEFEDAVNRFAQTVAMINGSVESTKLAILASYSQECGPENRQVLKDILDREFKQCFHGISSFKFNQ